MDSLINSSLHSLDRLSRSVQAFKRGENPLFYFKSC